MLHDCGERKKVFGSFEASDASDAAFWSIRALESRADTG